MKKGFPIGPALLILGGVAAIIFPDLLSKIFALIGAAVIIYNAIVIIAVFTGNKGGAAAAKGFAGAFVGLLIILLPTLLEFSIPVIVGVIIASAAIKRIVASFELKKNGSPAWIFSLVLGIALAVAALVFIFNPFGVSTLFKRIIGFVLIAVGILMLISDYKDNSGGSGDSVIHVDSYTVH